MNRNCWFSWLRTLFTLLVINFFSPRPWNQTRLFLLWNLHLSFWLKIKFKKLFILMLMCNKNIFNINTMTYLCPRPSCVWILPDTQSSLIKAAEEVVYWVKLRCDGVVLVCVKTRNWRFFIWTLRFIKSHDLIYSVICNQMFICTQLFSLTAFGSFGNRMVQNSENDK